MGKRSKMSDQLSYEIAKRLGVEQVVRQDGWGAVSSRDCGNIVKKAFEIAESNVSSKNA